MPTTMAITAITATTIPTIAPVDIPDDEPSSVLPGSALSVVAQVSCHFGGLVAGEIDSSELAIFLIYGGSTLRSGPGACASHSFFDCQFCAMKAPCIKARPRW